MAFTGISNFRLSECYYARKIWLFAYFLRTLYAIFMLKVPSVKQCIYSASSNQCEEKITKSSKSTLQSPKYVVAGG
jgi:hypothetical protein